MARRTEFIGLQELGVAVLVAGTPSLKVVPHALLRPLEHCSTRFDDIELHNIEKVSIRTT
jgi:hypothetical protein